MKTANNCKVLDCASPLVFSIRSLRSNGGRGLPHARTLLRERGAYSNGGAFI